ncbi:UDP-N-acetylmuramoyl-L-alanine--D-glutamate ligase [Paenibacillus sp. UNC499MF]|uniref:UDP-N-acetylmuramoyl-L-alanine--D-glutamate ligase n=1 Tax=Paenibacillus sp. UNC499MF TaxID=1502751 RepID=UPI0008A07F18|nr:UDP-N-acetylmuramoyl-L-alanine--D-glutamate ligase [Paenibacillus sp. UNC499MF]SEF51685.1 UDP-N-acetylmuramoylalanine--D-glutamate ligase [Paenibacillus sp. UNC499MF]
MKHPSEYRGKKVVVLGLARSGVAAAKFFHEMGADVTVNDRKTRDTSPEADELEALGISVVCGGHPPELVGEDTALIVKNPGIPYGAPPVVQAAEHGIEVVTEVEVAYHICSAPMIGITGSNGKTTTTTMVGLMLERGKLNPIVAGNIGRALTEAAAEAKPSDWMVVELSSFQLKGTREFRPKIACLLNIYETHLDYHGSMEDYVASKAKLFANQKQDDVAVLNADVEVCRKLAGEVSSKVLLFSTQRELDKGVYLSGDGVLTYRDAEGGTYPILPAKELGIRGSHNIENALAASAVALSVGAPVEAIADVLRTFRGVEHRLEFVGEFGGAAYYNDSKATNPAATTKTVESFDRSVILIAGGLDRGSDYKEMIPLLASRVKAVVTLGETREKINRAAREAGLTAIETVDTANSTEAMDEAVRAASKLAGEGDIVLLSPACASWDMFASYEERGRMFKESVHNL